MRLTPLMSLNHRQRHTGTHRQRVLCVERLEDRRMLAGRAAEAVNAFAFDLYEQMQREQGNLLFSPLSIATGLAMAYAGAAGQTADEMEQVLQLGAEPGIHDSIAELLESLTAVSLPFPPFGPTLTVANAIWPHMGFPLQPEFLATMQEDYGGHLRELDYSNPEMAEAIINNWVEAATKGKIRGLVSDLSPTTAMVLTNSVYFKGFWEHPFDRDYTSPQNFTRDDGSVISTPMMGTSLGDATKTYIDGYGVFEMPFEGGFSDADLSMVFVLPPRNGDGQMSSELYAQIDDWLDGPKSTTFSELWVPKFKTEVSTNLNDVLAGLGMPTAFELGAADFSGITPGEIAIDTVFHKTSFELNEEGTEAAAATEVSFYICFAKGTPVLTPDGERPIEELQVGDMVLARDEGNLEGELCAKRIDAVFRNEAAIVELRVGGQAIRTTAEHPFFVRRRGWTAAAEIRPGDSVSTNTAGWIAVEEVRPTNETVPVYNMRVADYRTYFVGSAKWGFGVWVHNSCIDVFRLDRSFHLLVRDNTTSTILFMGRINDPQQLQNEVTPTVVRASADFDGNHVVDGNDFLAWQRGLGRSTGAAKHDGDGDGDGDVDATDLGHWTHTFGQTSTPSVLPASASDALSPRNLSPKSLRADLLDAALKLNWTTSDAAASESGGDGEAVQPVLDDYDRAFDDPTFSSAALTVGRSLPSTSDDGASPQDADRTLNASLSASLAHDSVGLPPVL